MSAGPDRKANALWASGALELLEHAILLDAACDDDDASDVKVLVGEVNLLGRLRALELVDLKSVTIDTAKRGCTKCQRGVDAKANTRGPVGAPGLLERLQLRRCADCGSER